LSATSGDGVDAVTPIAFNDLVRWRRDVRRFKPDAVPSAAIEHLLATADLAPSVGNSQPWRIVKVESAENRAAVRLNFEHANASAAAAIADTQAQ
jgi:nitroreductase